VRGPSLDDVFLTLTGAGPVPPPLHAVPAQTEATA
jgi:hypothetical protein